jgi:Fur family ferric uptake transcriptional regulator
LDYIASLGGTHITAAQIVEHFKQVDMPIGRTTIYRHLEKLTETRKLRRYVTDGISGACYQFVDHGDDCHTHFHLKCEQCNELQHVECDLLNEIQHHFLHKHAFKINALKTVLYGECSYCGGVAT